MKIRPRIRAVVGVVCGVLAVAAMPKGAAGQRALGAAAAPVTPLAPACGATSDRFEVKSEYDDTYAPKVEAGKALVYFIEDDRQYGTRPRPTTKWGVDGKWVGATQSDAYFAVTVEPGEHHLCTQWQVNYDGEIALAHFTAEAGKTYYFRLVDVTSNSVEEPVMWMEMIDSDQGAWMVKKLRVSYLKPKS